MHRGATLLACGAVLAIAGCGGEDGTLTIRTSKAPVSAGAQPVPERIAEARGQFTLGNFALALESFRKALRDDPRSVAAMTGIAASYDRMGRFDLARRHYEAALAVEPANAQILTALAGSLDAQGHREEAAAVRAEIEQRAAAALASAEVAETPLPAPSLAAAEPMIASGEIALPGPVVAPMATAIFQAEAASTATAVQAPAQQTVAVAARSVTVALPPARPAKAIVDKAPSNAATPVAPQRQLAAATPVPQRSGARLERLSLGEVALVLNSRPQWQPTLVASSARSATVRFVPLKQAAASRTTGIRLLNAARIDGLAARTRTTLANRGWRNMVIGNAAASRTSSLVIYPATARVAARRLAAQFGFPLMLRADAKHVTVLLGRDAAARKSPSA